MNRLAQEEKEESIRQRRLKKDSDGSTPRRRHGQAKGKARSTPTRS